MGASVQPVRGRARGVLEAAWDDAGGYCVPNRRTYPHLWMWDSCFHAIAWLSLRDPRGLRELQAVFAGQLNNGFVPHMRYRGRTYRRGPLADVSSFTQPPVYAHALSVAAQVGMPADHALVSRAVRGMEALWRDRLRDGLLVVVHPWESGADDSPRWDGWVGESAWNRRRWTRFDRRLLRSTVFGEFGEAVGSPEFVAAPAAFNAISAHGAEALGQLLGEERWMRKAAELAEAIDGSWCESEGLWSDVAVTGGGPSVHMPTVDGVLPALCTPDPRKAARALEQLVDPERFGAPFGPTYVARTHPTYDPDAYWRGPAWPQLAYLAVLAARRWGRTEIADRLSTAARQACLTNGFSEYWNPETGAGRGARPQTWAAVVCAL